MDINTILQSIVLGIIQGLTEFIPVSSQAHLDLIPRILNWAQPSTLFIVFIHIGTLIALILYFRQDIFRYIQVLIKYIRTKGKLKSKPDLQDWRKLIYIAIATIPAGIAGVVLEEMIASFYDNPDTATLSTLLMITAMMILGIVFVFSGKLFTGKKFDIQGLGWLKALIIGISQALALFRGTSRSGITLITGQMVGLNRAAAAEFSFLMSIPIIAASSLWGVYKMLSLPTAQMQSQLPPALVGAIFAFIFGYISVRFLLNYLKDNTLVGFGVYRIIFGLITLYLLVLS